MNDERRTTMNLASRLTAAAAAALVASCAVFFSPDRSAQAPRLDGYGTVPMAVTTTVPAARALFERGMAQSYAFDEQEAARQFKAALALDPGCALCAWGVAKALGPDINNPERRDTAQALRYLRWASSHGVGTTPRERALVEAMTVRYTGSDATPVAPSGVPLPASICSAAGAGTVNPIDAAYAARMRALVDAYPDDADILSLYAEAALIALPDEAWDKKTGLPAGDIGFVAERLDAALAKHPRHTGLNHFAIHVFDGSPHPERALAAADRLGGLAPASPHLLHMPSHIYVSVGRFHDASEVNLAALAAEQSRNDELQRQGYAPGVDWTGHDRHFLWYAALVEGRGELALQQARVAATRAQAGTGASAEFTRSRPLLTLLRLQRWAELRSEPVPTGDTGLAAAAARYAIGIADARSGNLDAARAAAASLQAARAAPSLAKANVYADKATTVLEIWNLQLDAEIAVAERRADAGATAIARAVELEGALNSSEPPMLGAASRVAQGDLLRRAGRPAEAERSDRAELAARPGNGWALAGLQASLSAQGRGDEAAPVRGEAERAWAFADGPLKSALLK